MRKKNERKHNVRQRYYCNGDILCKVPVNTVCIDETAGCLNDPLAGKGNCLSSMHSHMLKQEAICHILADDKPELVCLANLCSLAITGTEQSVAC